MLLNDTPVLTNVEEDMKIAVNIGVDSSSEYYPSQKYPIFIRISFKKEDNETVAKAIKEMMLKFRKERKAGYIDVSYKEIYSFFGYFKQVRDIEKLLELLDDKDLYDRLNSKSEKTSISQLIIQAKKIYLSQAS